MSLLAAIDIEDDIATPAGQIDESRVQERDERDDRPASLDPVDDALAILSAHGLV